MESGKSEIDEHLLGELASGDDQRRAVDRMQAAVTLGRPSGTGPIAREALKQLLVQDPDDGASGPRRVTRSSG